MAQTYSANQFIGKTLIAKTNVSAFNGYPRSSSITMIPKGSIIGVVYSWVKDPDNAENVYWQFNKPDGKSFYVKHVVSSLSLHPEDAVKSTDQIKKEAKEKEEREQYGDLLYYGKRVFPWLIGISIASLATKLYVSRNKS